MAEARAGCGSRTELPFAYIAIVPGTLSLRSLVTTRRLLSRWGLEQRGPVDDEVEHGRLGDADQEALAVGCDLVGINIPWIDCRKRELLARGGRFDRVFTQLQGHGHQLEIG